MTRILAIAWLAACNPPAATAPSNAVPVAAQVHVAVGQPLGWLGFAPIANHADAATWWLPVGTMAAVVPASHDVARGRSLTAIDGLGRAAIVRAAAGTTAIEYGCDGNRLDAVTLATADAKPFAPGVVWVLPPSPPDAWAPQAIAIRSIEAHPTRRRYVIGPIALDLSRSDANHATLAIAWNGRVVHRVAIERAQMDGSDPTPIDLAEGGPGVPEPVAAWQIAKQGPILLVVLVPSYEGVHVSAILVERDAGRAVPELGWYLYRCAF